MDNKLPERFSVDLFTLVEDSQAVAANLNEVAYNKDNVYAASVEVAAIGLVLARGREKNVSDETIIKDILSRTEFLTQKLEEAEAAHAAGTCGCGHDHGVPEEN